MRSILAHWSLIETNKLKHAFRFESLNECKVACGYTAVGAIFNSVEI